MRVEIAELVQKFRSNGGPFESFIYDLVRKCARGCGIDPIHVEWDFRTNVPDGGRDLVVQMPNPNPAQAFIPARQSIWSLKSGDEGCSPTAFANEVTEAKHTEIRKALQEGWAYVWCTVYPASHPQRTAIRQRANQIATDLNINPDQFHFRWVEQLQTETNRYPNVILLHLSEIAAKLNNVRSLTELKRELKLQSAWVPFGGREDIIRRVRDHFLGTGEPNVLHIAGLSGIGKTRTVYETCDRTEALRGVFYIDSYANLTREVYRYLEDDDRHVHLIVDETPLAQLDTLVGRLREFANRVRVVTIGPALRDAVSTGPDVIVLPEPSQDGDFLDVIRAAGPTLSPEVQGSIAVQSGHDLRLGLLLVEAARKLPQFTGVPIFNFDGVWERLTVLYGSQIGDPNQFRTMYEILTATLDVGLAGEHEGELSSLATHFEQPSQLLRTAAAIAASCGLGVRTTHFFEAGPRALAVRMFESRVWPRLRDTLEAFFISLTERHARKFLERCQDCTGLVREEVTARVGHTFLKLLSKLGLRGLRGRNESRLFQSWAEFDPVRGLKWLRREVELATPDELRALEGNSDGTGGWRGRRQLVWLCQNLASFSGHFADCEAVLFRLALFETEPSIGNNSTALWKSLFWPVLAGTEVPFPARWPLLLRRLREATADELSLVLAGVFESLEPRAVGMPSPPRVVGGRLVPPPWRPSTHQEWATLRRSSAEELLKAIPALPSDRRPLAQDRLISRLRTFRELGLFAQVQLLFPPAELGDGQRRRLVVELESQLNHLRQVAQEDTRRLSVISELDDWLSQLATPDVATRVRDLTARDYWSVFSPEQQAAPYEQLADELIADPTTLPSLKEWFDGPDVRSADPLGFSAGRRDTSNRLETVVRDWLAADSARGFTLGYLSGTTAREGSLPATWAETLDAIATKCPELVALATATADIGPRGLERLMGLLDRLPPPASRFIKPLAYGNWLTQITPSQRLSIGRALVRLAEAGDQEALSVGVDLISMWAHGQKTPLDPQLVDLALDIVARPPPLGGRRASFGWDRVLAVLADSHPRRVAEIVVNVLTSPDLLSGRLSEGHGEVLARAARRDPGAVMSVLGDAILDPKRRGYVEIVELPGVPEAIGPIVFDEWSKRHGREHLRWLAKHFPSPSLGKSGEVVVPPVTDWLFRELEDNDSVFNRFLLGRHPGFRNLSSADPTKKREEMQPFLQHPHRRVRDWAEYEIETERQDAEELTHIEEEDERL